MQRIGEREPLCFSVLKTTKETLLKMAHLERGSYLSNRGRFPRFHSLIQTRGGVGRSRDSYANPRRSRGFASVSRILPGVNT